MKVRELQAKDLEKLYAFNDRMFPEREVKSREYMQFWLSKSAEEMNYDFVIVDDNDDIHGEILSSTMSYFYEGKLSDSLWGFDLIVEDELRKEGWGVDIQLYRNQVYPVSFGTGVAPTALKIQSKMGYALLGHIRKFACVVSPFWAALSVVRKRVSPNSYPDSITFGGHGFIKTRRENLPNLNKPFNEHLWEPARDNKYLSWRYFSPLHEYVFYKDLNSDDFFVMRSVVFKHLVVNMLVDYRCDIKSAESVESIIKAAEKVTKSIHLGVLVTGSSLASFDKVLKKRHYIEMGDPRPINGIIKVKDRKKDIESRDFCFVTFADSDGETDIV